MITSLQVLYELACRSVRGTAALLGLARAGASQAATAYELREICRVACGEGYTPLSVEGGGPIEMLLIRGNERVAVLSSACLSWPRWRLEMVRSASDSDSIWLPSDWTGNDGPGLRHVQVGLAA